MKLTQEVLKELYSEATRQTLDTLPEFIKHVINDYELDYNTVVDAVAICAIADELENCNNASCAAHYEKNVQKASEYISWMEHPGFNNKMFVAADMMIHQIRITDVRVEKLQDISDDDCLKQGVVVNEPKIKGGINMYYPCEYLRSCAKEVGWGRVFHTPREAFANLINKVSRKDTWESNPYVFVYDFELVK